MYDYNCSRSSKNRKTGSENFEQRMHNLKINGYVNVVGLKRRFAIEVEDYDEKEILIWYLYNRRI